MGERMPIGADKTGGFELERITHKIAVYPWAVAMPEDVLSGLKNGRIETTRILLDRMSPHTIGPTRKIIDNGTPTISDAHGAVSTAPRILPIQTTRGNGYTFMGDAPLSFTSPDGDIRSITISALPVLPPELLPTSNKRNSKPSISLTYNQFTEVLETGYYVDPQEEKASPLFVSLAYLNPDPNTSSEEQERVQNRNNELTNLSDFFGRIDWEVERTIIDRIGSNYGITFGAEMSLLDVYTQLQVDNDRFDPKIADPTILEAVEYARTTIQMSAHKEREGTVEEDLPNLIDQLRIALNSGTFGRELLESALVESLQKRSIQGATELHSTFELYWNEIYHKSLKSLKLFSDDLFPHTLKAENAESAANNAQAVSQGMLEQIAANTGHSLEYIQLIYQDSLGFLPYLTKTIDLERNESAKHSRETRNENQGANLATLYLNSETHPDPVVRFEAKRELIIFMKYIFATEYRQKIVDESCGLLDIAIGDFFGPNDGTNVKVNRKDFKQRLGKDGKHRIVDKRIKPIESIVRVSFQKPLQEIEDIFADNIVAVNGATDYAKAIQENTNTIDSFIESTRKLYPECGVVAKKRKADGVEAFLTWINDESIPQDNKGRAGSNGNMIIREKLVLEITKSDKTTESAEISFFPFAKLGGKREVLGNAKKVGFKAFEEKRLDDKRYGDDRVVKALKIPGIVGQKSLYQIFYPSVFFPPV